MLYYLFEGWQEGRPPRRLQVMIAAYVLDDPPIYDEEIKPEDYFPPDTTVRKVGEVDIVMREGDDVLLQDEYYSDNH